MGCGNQLVGKLHIMTCQTVQHWHISHGGIFIQIHNANLCELLEVCLILRKEIKHEAGGWINHGLESFASE